MSTSSAVLSSLGDLTGKRVLVRSDLNVPLDGTTITDDGRIRASVPTITQLSDAGARVVVTAHLGRPDGRHDPTYSLEPVAARLSELLGKPVAFATDTVGSSATATVEALQDGEIAVLENVRFNDGETSKDDDVRASFADQRDAGGVASDRGVADHGEVEGAVQLRAAFTFGGDWNSPSRTRSDVVVRLA